MINPDTRENKQKLEDLCNRSKAYSRWSRARRPKKIGDIVAQVVQRKGYAQAEAARQLEEAWSSAVGELGNRSTRVGKIRRGNLEIIVASSLVMQELSFRKKNLLTAMQKSVPEAQIEQLRFRVGKIA